MKKANIVKVGILSLSGAAVLAACGAEGAENIDLSQIDLSEIDVEQIDVSQIEEVIQNVTEGNDGAQSVSVESATQTQTEGTQNSDTAQQESPGIENVEFEVSVQEAIDMFLTEFDNPHIDEIEFDREDGRYVYDFEGWDGEFEYEMEIDAQTGEILSVETERDTDHDDILELEDILSPQEAMAIALEVSGGRYVEEWDLEVEDGFTVYDIDVEGGEDVDVDAHTGEIR